MAQAVATRMKDGEWYGDMDDDCFLRRYGLFAHVEKMDRGHWWFAISVGDGTTIGARDIYNGADALAVIRLRDGDAARAAAEHCMELIHANKLTGDEHEQTRK